MKKLALFATLSLLIIIAMVMKPTDKAAEQQMPQPTDGTVVKMDHEDIPKKAARTAWFELMHHTSDGSDWREVEFNNSLKSAKYKRDLRAQYSSRNGAGEEVVAEGNLSGTWTERGSDNNAGNMITVNYFPEEDMLFGRSAGGTLWKGDRSGFEWEVVNQDYRFEGDLVEMRYLPDGNIRYLSILNKDVVYSDDGGQTWTPSEGLNATSSAKVRDFVEDKDGNMYFLYKRTNINRLAVYRSIDNGTSWQNIYALTGRNELDHNLVNIGGTNNLMIIEQLDTDETRLHLIDTESGTGQVLNDSSPLGFGADDDRANLNAVYFGDTLRLFALSPAGNEQNLFTSLDTGHTWTLMSKLPTNPWNVGLYVSPSDPSKMMYGEVDSYRTENGGDFWIKNSNWWEYYDDIFTKLHADIMDIKEFETEAGEPFYIVCNHGGVSQSFDYGQSFENIALASLNIGQYYSVVTHPTEREFVYAGAQDQGLQRGRITGDGIASLDQVISGDYGHMVFSGPEDHFWAMYPGGAISYYQNELTGSPSSWYTIESLDETVWIPPVISHRDKTQNAVFIAGGDINGVGGSRVIRLDVSPTGQIEPSQFDFDFSSTGGGTISTLAMSPFDHEIMYVATTGGFVFTTTDGGVTFERKQVGLPSDHYLYGACIKPSEIDPNTIYFAGSGYGNPGVMVSRDGGESYEPMSNGLPSTMVFCIAANEDESLIYAATEAGPYVYIADQDQWFELSGTTTPNQTYWSVEFLPETKTARFGTYGRGIWDFALGSGNPTSTNDLAKVDIKVFPNPTADYLNIESEIVGTAQLLVADQAGRTQKMIMVSDAKKSQIDISELPSGIYFVTLRSDNGSVTEKIIKQ